MPKPFTPPPARALFAALMTACLVMPVCNALGNERPAGTDDWVAVRAARLIDVETGRVVDNPVVLIHGDRIEAVGRAEAVKQPPQTRVIDLGKRTLLPGLIDTHTHLTSDARRQGYSGLAVSDVRAALYGATAARLTLMAGFTAVRNVGADGFGDVALRDAINEDGLPGPRMQVSAYALGIQGGHCDNNLLPHDYNVIGRGVADGPWAARAKVREMVKFGADLIKICATGGVLSKGDSPGAQQYTLEEMQAIVDEAHKLGRRVAAHAHGTSGIRDAIKAGVDSIEHASLIDDEGITLAKKHGTVLVMDIYNDDFILTEGEKAGILKESLDKEREIGKKQRENFQRAWSAGAPMAYGTDSGVYPHGDNAKQFAYMVKFGMSPMQAIQSATIQAARLMGWEDRIGSVKAGKFADLIAVDEDPLTDITRLNRVSFVMKSGSVAKDERR